MSRPGYLTTGCRCLKEQLNLKRMRDCQELRLVIIDIQMDTEYWRFKSGSTSNSESTKMCKIFTWFSINRSNFSYLENLLLRTSCFHLIQIQFLWLKTKMCLFLERQVKQYRSSLKKKKTVKTSILIILFPYEQVKKSLNQKKERNGK